jgi:pilus assembly protein Flp/PilA
MSPLHTSLYAFLRDDDGAQVVEYALIIAVVSIALVIALSGLTGLPIGDLITRINNCLAGSCS